MPQFLTSTITDASDGQECWQYSSNSSVNYTVAEGDVVVLADSFAGPVTITLPPAADKPGRVITVKKVDPTTNALIIDGDGSETIDGDLTKSLAAQYTSITLISNGTEWFII